MTDDKFCRAPNPEEYERHALRTNIDDIIKQIEELKTSSRSEETKKSILAYYQNILEAYIKAYKDLTGSDGLI